MDCCMNPSSFEVARRLCHAHFCYASSCLYKLAITMLTAAHATKGASVSRTLLLAALALAMAGGGFSQMTLPVDAVTNELAAKYGEGQRERAARGVKQAAAFWRADDGDAAAFAEFARANFAGDAKTLDALFDRME